MDALSHRKATVRLRVMKADGQPAARCRVQLDQQKQAFLFGCGATPAEMLAHARTEEQRQAAEQLLEKWLALFNYGTLHFYWGRYEREQGQTDREPMMAAARLLREKGVTMKGHPLCWHTACANWLLQYGNAEILRRQVERIHRDVTDFCGLVDMWDVINEVVIMPVFDKYDNPITRICQEYGRVRLVREVFEAARESNPSAVLLINDFETGPAYAAMLADLLDAGIPITAIGIQSHQHQGYWGLEKLQRVLERYARFGLPIHFTENTLISGELMPPHIVDLNDWQVDEWPTTPEGEERQAREVEEMYRTLFAHPQVEAITAWDFTDRCWLNAPAGFLRRDGSEKPSYQVLRRLIHGEWETHTGAVTDENGFVEVTGFRGDYRLSSDEGGAQLQLLADGAQTVTLGR